MFRFGDGGGYPYGTIGGSAVNLVAWWNGTTNLATNFSLTSGGAFDGRNSLHVQLANSYISKTLDAQSTWGIAFRIKFGVPLGVCILFGLYDSGTLQCDLRMNTDMTLSITRNGTTLGSTPPLVLGGWNHVEWKTVINNSTGTIDVKVNGVSVLSLTSQDTQNTANASANSVRFGNLSGSFGLFSDYNDIVIWDGQTTDPQGNSDIHDFIGDCGLSWGLPTGAGTTTQFTPDSGSNYARVNEATPDTTSYVEDSTVGHIDTYAMADLPASAVSVKSMAVVTYAEKTDVGSRTFCAELRTNSANFAGSTSQSLGNSYAYYFNNWGQNPSGTPANWTVADINAIESGQKVLT